MSTIAATTACPPGDGRLLPTRASPPSRGAKPLSLILTGPAPAFGANAHRGEWSGRQVLALLGPQVAGATQLSHARAAPLIGASPEGAWPLLDVVEHEGRPTWLYPAHPGASGAALLAAPPPMRVGLELAVAAIEALRLLAGSGLEHPGPLPEDVWVTADGSVSLASLVGPSLPSPSRRPPQVGASPEADRTYRAAVLACELLGGDVSPAGASEDEQRVVQRRAAIRMMA